MWGILNWELGIGIKPDGGFACRRIWDLGMQGHGVPCPLQMVKYWDVKYEMWDMGRQILEFDGKISD